MNLDWTAIAVAGLGAVMTVVGWAIRSAFGKLDRHMDKVECFMEESGRNQAVMATEIKNHDQRFSGVERWVQGIENRVNDSHRIRDIQEKVTDLHTESERRGA